MEKKNEIAILIAEDDLNLGVVLKDFLNMQGYRAVLCRDGNEALEAFNDYAFDVCILDVMMPKKDGFTLAKDIRKLNAEIPIVFLTAKSLQEDLIKGFKTGCDDYITKPFSTEELSLRLQAILKRCVRKGTPVKLMGQRVTIGKFVFDQASLMLKSDDYQKRLTPKEAGLLKLLVENQNQILRREVAMSEVWEESSYFISRSMDVFIARLRKYLSSDPSISIVNVHGSGFMLQILDEDEQD
jgi:two-component system, OmpR family, response regulator